MERYSIEACNCRGYFETTLHYEGEANRIHEFHIEAMEQTENEAQSRREQMDHMAQEMRPSEEDKWFYMTYDIPWKGDN
jgi:hypothetical protein